MPHVDQAGPLGRRALLIALAAAPLAGIAGCAMNREMNLADAIRRLLTLSSQRALARLMAPNGFYDSQVARITLPEGLGDSREAGMLGRLLTSTLLRDRLLRQVNRAAERGADRAAPVIAHAIVYMPVADAVGVLRGGGSAATNLLRSQMGDALFAALVPGVDEGLRLFDNEVLTEVLRITTGVDFAGIRNDVARKASDAIYRAIGDEERAIRADPRSTRDALLIGALAAIGG